MRWDEIQKAWPEVKSQIRLHWCRLSDEDLEQSGGRRDRIVDRIEQCYGVRKANVERELDRLIERL
jgi:uncharacterized protein YjbJ (UPF0337 family)